MLHALQMLVDMEPAKAKLLQRVCEGRVGVLVDDEEK